MAVIQLPDRLVDWLLDQFAGQREHRQRRHAYLDYCSSSCSTPGGDWAPELDMKPLPLREAFVPLRFADSQGHVETLSAVLSKCQHLVLQGQAGAGKSSLVRFVAHVLAEARRNPAHREQAEQLLGIRPLFPLCIELKKYREGLCLHHLVLHSVETITGEWVERLLTEGGVLIMLDGLDEIASVRLRDRAMEEIGQLTHRQQVRQSAHDPLTLGQTVQLLQALRFWLILPMPTRTKREPSMTFARRFLEWVLLPAGRSPRLSRPPDACETCGVWP